MYSLIQVSWRFEINDCTVEEWNERINESFSDAVQSGVVQWVDIVDVAFDSAKKMYVKRSRTWHHPGLNLPGPTEPAITEDHIKWKPLETSRVRHIVAVSPVIWFLAVIFWGHFGDLPLATPCDTVYRPYRAFP